MKKSESVTSKLITSHEPDTVKSSMTRNTTHLTPKRHSKKRVLDRNLDRNLNEKRLSSEDLSPCKENIPNENRSFNSSFKAKSQQNEEGYVTFKEDNNGCSSDEDDQVTIHQATIYPDTSNRD